MEHKDVFILEDVIKYCNLTTNAIKEYGDAFDDFKNNVFF